MTNLEERVAMLEGRVQEQAAHMTDLRGMGTELRQELGALRQEMHESTTALRQEMHESTTALRQELHESTTTLRRELHESAGAIRQELRQSIGEVSEELHQSTGELRAEMRDLREDTERRFTWLVGIMVTGFLAVIGTVAGAFWRLLQVVQAAPR